VTRPFYSIYGKTARQTNKRLYNRAIEAEDRSACRRGLGSPTQLLVATAADRRDATGRSPNDDDDLFLNDGPTSV